MDEKKTKSDAWSKKKRKKTIEVSSEFDGEEEGRCDKEQVHTHEIVDAESDSDDDDDTLCCDKWASAKQQQQ